MPLRKGGNGQDAVLVPDDALGNAPDGHGDAVIGCAFFLDDLIGAVPDAFVKGVQVLPVGRFPNQLAKIPQIHAGNIGAAPNGQFAVPVFPDDKGVDAAAVHPQVFPQQVL